MSTAMQLAAAALVTGVVGYFALWVARRVGSGVGLVTGMLRDIAELPTSFADLIQALVTVTAQLRELGDRVGRLELFVAGTKVAGARVTLTNEGHPQ